MIKGAYFIKMTARDNQYDSYDSMSFVFWKNISDSQLFKDAKLKGGQVVGLKYGGSYRLP
jgi:hypothetical protein